MLNSGSHCSVFSLVFLVLTVTCTSAHADLIVSNFSETGGGGYGLNSNFFGFQSNKVAQQFNSGGRDVRLTSVSVMILRDSPSLDFTAEIWSTSNTNSPGTILGTLTLANNPAPSTFNKYSFRADGAIQLDGQTDYFFSVKDNASNTSALAGSVFGSNNFTGPGNVLENVWLFPNSGNAWAPFGSNAVLIEIVGTPEPGSFLLLGMAAFGCLSRRRRGT